MANARGRPPVPLKILQLRGSRWAKNRKDPEAPEGRPQAPATLSAEEKQKFDETCDKLEVLGLLAETDADAIALYSKLWIKLQETEEFLRKYGDFHVVTDKGGNATTKLYPQAKLYLQLVDKLRVMTREFGLTPAGRAKKGIERAKKTEDKARFFRSG